MALWHTGDRDKARSWYQIAAVQSRDHKDLRLVVDLLFADFDNDGDPDLAAASYNGGLSILANAGK